MIDLSGACAPTLCQMSRLQAVLETDHPTLARQFRHHFGPFPTCFPAPSQRHALRVLCSASCPCASMLIGIGACNPMVFSDSLLQVRVTPQQKGEFLEQFRTSVSQARLRRARIPRPLCLVAS